VRDTKCPRPPPRIPPSKDFCASFSTAHQNSKLQLTPPPAHARNDPGALASSKPATNRISVRTDMFGLCRLMGEDRPFEGDRRQSQPYCRRSKQPLATDKPNFLSSVCGGMNAWVVRASPDGETERRTVRVNHTPLALPTRRIRVRGERQFRSNESKTMLAPTPALLEARPRWSPSGTGFFIVAGKVNPPSRREVWRAARRPALRRLHTSRQRPFFLRVDPSGRLHCNMKRLAA